jgi:thioredoxin 1
MRSQASRRGENHLFIELDEQSLEDTLRDQITSKAYFFYTPFCGTCKVAQKMCAVAMEALPGTDVYACNVNFFPKYVQKWMIESVPCLIIACGGVVLNKVYAFESVNKVYRLLSSMPGR